MPLTSNKSLITLLVFIACIILSASSQGPTIMCDPNNRPDPNDCSGDNPRFNPESCAYYKEDCPFEICGRTVYDDCQACSDPDVLYYTEYPCDPDIIVSKCPEQQCIDFPDLFSYYNPVCGVCPNGECSQTYGNPCMACEDPSVGYYQSRPCQQDRFSCSRVKCMVGLNNLPICAYFTISVGDMEVFATIENAPTACKDPAVSFYTKGRCGPQPEGIEYCLPNNRPKKCKNEDNPVCGYYYDPSDFFDGDDDGPSSGTWANPCAACRDSRVIYHRPGPC